jgi:predicted nucleic acid-binding protein
VKYVVDANRVVRALIRDGRTRREFILTDAELFAPLYLKEELQRHKAEILKRAPVSPDELDAALAVLEARIKWVAEGDIEPYLEAAHDAVAKIDPKDARYVACALAVKADALWTFDKKLRKQSLVPTIPHLPVPSPAGEGETSPRNRTNKTVPPRPCSPQCRQSMAAVSRCKCKGCGGKNHGTERPVGVAGILARVRSFLIGPTDE